MSIEIKKIGSVKKVKKPWGYEKWIADGAPNFKYALKEIFFKSGFKSSNPDIYQFIILSKDALKDQ